MRKIVGKLRQSKRRLSKRIPRPDPSPRRLEEKARFLAAYKSNPCNRFPGPILFKFYRAARTQEILESMAAKWLAERKSQ